MFLSNALKARVNKPAHAPGNPHKPSIARLVNT